MSSEIHSKNCGLTIGSPAIESPAPELGENETVRRNEFRFGTFRRVLSLPVAIDPKAVSADYTAGILVLTLPKAEDELNKVVKVNIAGTQPAAIADSTAGSSDESVTQ